MLARSLSLIGLVVLVGTALSAMGSLPPGVGTRAAAPDAPAAAGVPAFRCELRLSPEGAATAVAARVTADRAIAGRYDLSLRSGTNVIAQDGAFEARARETVTLGEATLPGLPGSLDATLTVTAAGATVACPRAGG